jgi:opacity protein-like surface antigen
MKRFLMLVGVAVVAAAMYVAASPASQQSKGPTLKQFNALKAKVASLSKSEKALKKVVTDCVQVAIPINQFGDPDGSLSGTAQGYDYGKTTFPGDPGPTTGFFTTGLDVTAPTDAGAAWFVGAKGSAIGSVCATDLGETALRHGATKGKLRFAGTLSH